jgi:hypothetical protein
MLPPKTFLTEELLLERAKSLIEEKVGWGGSDTWTNQDFIQLSEQILEKTGVNLSPTTLKRVWGRVKYDSAPSTTTLDTLVNFVGYENWRAFKSRDGNGMEHKTETTLPLVQEKPSIKPPSPKTGRPYKAGLFVIVTASLLGLAYFLSQREPTLNPDDFTFSSKTTVTEGVPNSVIFDFDATRSPYDSVIIQQSWNASLQTRLPRQQRQHTSIYYYPNNFLAKLIVGKQIVKEHNLLIQSNGWLPLIEQSPVPVYLKREDVIAGGKMAIGAEHIRANHLNPEPEPPTVYMTNVRDYGEIYTDDFVFETSLRNDYREGSGVCQNTTLYLNCVNQVIWIPLSAKGCVSDVDLAFSGYYRQGKQSDLSAFGVDFSDYVKLRIESKNGKAQILINDRLAHTVSQDIVKAKIIGISYRFRGAGSVDYVRLSNGQAQFEDDFER